MGQTATQSRADARAKVCKRLIELVAGSDVHQLLLIATALKELGWSEKISEAPPNPNLSSEEPLREQIPSVRTAWSPDVDARAYGRRQYSEGWNDAQALSSSLKHLGVTEGNLRTLRDYGDSRWSSGFNEGKANCV